MELSPLLIRTFCTILIELSAVLLSDENFHSLLKDLRRPLNYFAIYDPNIICTYFSVYGQSQNRNTQTSNIILS